MRLRSLAPALTVLAALAGAPAVRAEAIGDVVSVVPQASVARAGASRELKLDELLEQDDHVITTGDGSAYLHFIDDTVLTIGANSEVVLDKFVFDGERAKTASIDLVRGTLRFVTGKSDHGAYRIRTPVATIGVRGTTIDLSYENDRMLYNTVRGLGVVCSRSGNCRNMRAGAAPIALDPAGFTRTTAAEAAHMLRVITRSTDFLARRIGRAPGKMLSFAKSRGAGFARGLRHGIERATGRGMGRGIERGIQKGLNPRNLGKGLGGKPHRQNFNNPLRGNKLFKRP